MRWKTPLALAILLCGPAGAQDRTCQSPLAPMLKVEFYFGRSVEGGRPVSDRDWAQFLRRELTPRFPGLTVVDARGAWRRGEHDMREHTKLVIAVLPDSPTARNHIAEAAEAYRHEFHQSSVGIVTQAVCAAF